MPRTSLSTEACPYVQWECRALLAEADRRGWLLWTLNPTAAGRLFVAAVVTTGGVADVAILTTDETAVGYRAPILPGESPFDAQYAAWHLADTPVHVLRAALCLDPPDVPMPLYPIPDVCRVAAVDCQATRVRLDDLWDMDSSMDRHRLP